MEQWKRNSKIEILLMQNREGLSLEDVKKHFGIERATAQRDMKCLKDAGLVTFKGAAKTGKYVLAEKALKLFGN